MIFLLVGCLSNSKFRFVRHSRRLSGVKFLRISDFFQEVMGFFCRWFDMATGPHQKTY